MTRWWSRDEDERGFRFWPDFLWGFRRGVVLGLFLLLLAALSHRACPAHTCNPDQGQKGRAMPTKTDEALCKRFGWYGPHQRYITGAPGGRCADLTNADLRDADLTAANLMDANLRGANLRAADLTRADLTNANLRGADLTNAYLTRANLTNADLTNADLRAADLTAADLMDANLRNANLTRANLRNADLRGTVLDPLNPPNGKHDGFEAVEIDGVLCAKGYRTRNSPVIGGPGYEPGKTYVAQVFSTCEQTECHPGLYLEPVRKGPHGICVYAPLKDMHGVNNKFRARRFVRVEAVR